MTFAEYLRSQGATPEEITVLDTPTARKAYDAMEARISEMTTKTKAYEDNVAKYYEDTKSEAEKRDRELVLSRAEAARSRAALIALQERGLIDVAKDLGYDPKEPVKVEPTPPKYVTQDDIIPALNSAGDGLATLVDIAREHERLFPNIPFSARELRNEQIKTGKTFEQFWSDKYNVPAARQAASEARQKAHDEEVAKKAVAEAQAKWISEYTNPATRPLAPSNSPFVIKKTPEGQAQQPWARSEDQNSDARVRRATEELMKRQAAGATN